MVAKNIPLVDRLIACLEEREREDSHEPVKGKKPAELMGTRLDLHWEGFYDRLRCGYKAISDLQKKKKKSF